MAIIGKSRQILNGADPKLQALVVAVDAIFPVSVLCSIRTKEDQDKAFKEKKSKVQYPNSKHNLKPGEIFSQAVDIIPFFKERNADGNYDWKDLIAFGRMAGVMFAEASRLGIPIRWGGDWDQDGRTRDETFQDLPHFELIP